jgi:hypothetical protein
MSANASRRPTPPTGWAAVSAAAGSCSAGALRGKRLVGLLALVGLPVVVQLVLLVWGQGRGSAFAAFAAAVDHSYLRAIIPLVLIFLGTAAFGDEWDSGTANYMVGAPIGRGLIVVGRFVTAVAARSCWCFRRCCCCTSCACCRTRAPWPSTSPTGWSCCPSSR